MRTYNKVMVSLALCGVCFLSGCGLIAAIGTPNRHEKKVPAEYDLSKHKDKKILVLVNQPVWVAAEVNLRYYITEAMNSCLAKQTGIDPELLIDYEELAAFRSGRSDWSKLSAAEIGKALDADIVVLVEVVDCTLNEIARSGYYKGSLSARSSLLDTASGAKLWPESVNDKIIRVGFDAEQGGNEAAFRRLAVACSYCTVRYFYDCLKHKFKIADDRSGTNWQHWD